jgi:hypothetical protein
MLTVSILVLGGQYVVVSVCIFAFFVLMTLCFGCGKPFLVVFVLILPFSLVYTCSVHEYVTSLFTRNMMLDNLRFMGWQDLLCNI